MINSASQPSAFGGEHHHIVGDGPNVLWPWDGVEGGDVARQDAWAPPGRDVTNKILAFGNNVTLVLLGSAVFIFANQGHLQTTNPIVHHD